MPRGILKNAREDAAYKHESPNELDREKEVFDRQKVIENTRLNAKLTHGPGAAGAAASGPGLADIELKRQRGETLSEEEQLRWDERNLLINEMEKSATMKIDEPKTPYEGGFDPNNEYYRTDNEADDDKRGGDGDAGDDAFELGEGVDDADDVNKGEIEVVQRDAASQPAAAAAAAPEPTAEDKHRLFEEKRKQHYHLKAAPLKHPVADDDDDDDNGNGNSNDD